MARKRSGRTAHVQPVPLFGSSVRSRGEAPFAYSTERMLFTVRTFNRNLSIEGA